MRQGCRNRSSKRRFQEVSSTGELFSQLSLKRVPPRRLAAHLLMTLIRKPARPEEERAVGVVLVKLAP